MRVNQRFPKSTALRLAVPPLLLVALLASGVSAPVASADARTGAVELQIPVSDMGHDVAAAATSRSSLRPVAGTGDTALPVDATTASAVRGYEWTGIRKQSENLDDSRLSQSGCRDVMVNGGFEQGADANWKLESNAIRTSTREPLVLGDVVIHEATVDGMVAFEGNWVAYVGRGTGIWMNLYQTGPVAAPDASRLQSATLSYYIAMIGSETPDGTVDDWLAPIVIDQDNEYEYVPKSFFSEEVSGIDYGHYYKIELDLSDALRERSGLRSFRIGFRTEQDDAAASAFVVDGVVLEVCEAGSPEPRETPAPTSTPRAGPDPIPSPPTEPSKRSSIYLPVAMRIWPPVPGRPSLMVIDNSDGDGTYTVSWSSSARASRYTLQEATGPGFADARQVYSGRNLSWTALGKELGGYYYRVKAGNNHGESLWSSYRATAVNRARVVASADSAVIEHAVRKVGDLGSLWLGYHKAPCLDYRGNLGQARSLIKFDLSRIPRRATIRRATLTVDPILMCWSDHGRRTYRAHRAKSSWSEMGARWGNRPAHAESYGSISRNVSRGDSSIMNPFQFDVTTLVRKWFRGDEPNHGLVLVGPESSGSNFSILLLASREYSSSGSRPQLDLVLDGMGSAAAASDGPQSPSSVEQVDVAEAPPVCETRGTSSCCIDASLAETADGQALLDRVLSEIPGSER